jgi:hypothetical protein
MLEKLLNLDSQLFLLLNSYHSPVWDKIMWFISGKYEWIPLYAILVGFLVFKYKWRSVYIFIAVALLVTLADQISTNVFKEGIKRLRPSHVESLQHAIHLFVRENGEVYRGDSMASFPAMRLIRSPWQHSYTFCLKDGGLALQFLSGQLLFHIAGFTSECITLAILLAEPYWVI